MRHDSTPVVLSSCIDWCLGPAGDCCLAVPRGVSVGASRGASHSLECGSETSIIRHDTLAYKSPEDSKKGTS